MSARFDAVPGHEVTGTVTLDGKPLPGATVIFQPEDGSRPSIGVTDESGRYELGYTQKVKGALVGKHRVSITTGQEGEDDSGETVIVVEQVPVQYNVESQLVKEVTSGSNEIDFPLDSKGEKDGVGVTPPPGRADGCGGTYDPDYNDYQDQSDTDDY